MSEFLAKYGGMETQKEKTKPILIDAKLVSKKMLTSDVFELKLESSAPFQFQPGQFISVLIPGAGPAGRDLRRAYSIASAPEMMPGENCFELCVKLVEGGPGTNYLNNLQIGQAFKGHVPFGDFVYKTSKEKHVIFVATGTGIAPFRSMVYSKVYNENKPLSAKILFGVRDSSDLFYTEELAPLLGKGYVEALSRPSGQWSGFQGRVTDWLRQNSSVIDWKNTEFYLCGNGAMITEVKAILTEMAVDKSAIHQEVYYK